jgi:hypothetical protein
MRLRNQFVSSETRLLQAGSQRGCARLPDSFGSSILAGRLPGVSHRRALLGVLS